MQIGLNALGFKLGIADGDEGPKTKAAYSAWLASLSSNMNDIIKIAQTQVGLRETSKNQGEGLAKFWTATSYPDGYENREPYCAAFVCWVIREAFKGKTVPFTLPTSPVAYDFEKWGAANKGRGVEVLVLAKSPQPGDIFTLAAASHVGLVKSVNGSEMVTIEGNTNEAGSREGDGVYEKKRNVSSIRKIVRITV